MTDVAIVGYSLRLPEVNNADEYWDLLIKNELAIRDLPESRQVLSNNKITHMRRGGFIKQAIDEFDAKFFHISTREAPFMDPQQRLLLELTWEALENSNIDGTKLKNELVGVFVGMWSTGYNNILRDSKIHDTCEIHEAYLGSIMSSVVASISYFLKCSGPNLAVDAGCASSLNSVHYACESLNSFESNLCIAGGVNLIVDNIVGKPNSLILSPTGVCKTYDKSADGFGRADGIGILILKRLQDALKDNDDILGVIKSTAINCDGSGNNYGTPCKLGQARVMRSALEKAKIKPQDMAYIETHGTGTQIGDPIEINSIKTVFDHHLKIGSVKTNIGHTEGASGVAAIIKVLLMFKYNKIPAHLNLKNLHPDIQLKNIEIVTENCDFKGEFCGVSAFALSGHNAHVILGRGTPPKQISCQASPQTNIPLTALTLSGKGEEALEATRLQYIEFLEKKDLQDVAYTANTCRAHLPNRIFVTGKNSEDVILKLRYNDFQKGCAKVEKSMTAFLFTDLNAKPSEDLDHAIFRETQENCLQYVKEGIQLTNQIKNFITQYSLFRLWKSFGLTPDFVLGYGTGEFSAAAAAGIMSVEDAINVISQLKVFENKTVAAVKTSEENIQNLLKGHPEVSICAVNSPDEVAVAGNTDVIKNFSEFCLKNGCKTRRIPGHVLYEPMEIFIDTLPSEIGFVSGSRGQLLGDNHFMYDEEYWSDLVSGKVDFSNAVKVLVDSGCRSFVELGPHPVLLGHLMENLQTRISQSSVWVPSLRNNENGYETLFSSLGKLFLFGVQLDWRGIQNQHRNKIILPNYPFQRSRYWVEF